MMRLTRSGKTREYVFQPQWMPLQQRAPGFYGPCGVDRENNRKNHVAWRWGTLVEAAKFHQYLFRLSFPGHTGQLYFSASPLATKWSQVTESGYGMEAEVIYTTFRPGLKDVLKLSPLPPPIPFWSERQQAKDSKLKRLTGRARDGRSMDTWVASWGELPGWLPALEHPHWALCE